MSDPVRPDAPSAPAAAAPVPAAAAPLDATGVAARFEALRNALEGRYALERELASGAMGVVLRARDLRHDRAVAVKVLRPELASAAGADRFLREVRTAAGLLHPGIVTVYDSGEAGGLLYYVMPMVEGEALRERLERERSLPIAEAVRIAGQVAEALAFAHAHGIVHRDIKPENILLATHGHAQVTDFGVARAISAGEVRLTGTGAMLGSPLYLSPEQAAGSRVDGRADVYSLGCVLYEMLVGVAPFEGSFAAVLAGHLTAPPPSASARRPDVPAVLEELIQRALAKLPRERLTAKQMCDALAEVPVGTALGSSPAPVVLAPRAEPMEPPIPPASLPPGAASRRRTRRLWLAAGTLAIAAAAGILELRAGPLLTTLFRAGPPPDSTRYAVFPFRRDASVPATLAEADRVRDELALWQGLDVIDAGDAAAVLTHDDSAGVDPARARRLAQQLHAGRFVSGRITREGDSLRIYAQVGDAGAAGRTRGGVRLVVPAALPDPAGTFRALADSLALAGLGAACVVGGTGTRSLPALRHCDQAFTAIDEGDLAAADSLLRLALKVDPRYARAALWLAQASGWLVERPPPSAELMTVVNAGRAALPPREQTLAEALGLMDAGRYAEACRDYASLTAADSLDVAAWLGLGECHRRDNIVVRDPRSPSGWAFRGSYYQAVLAYRRAFEIRPQMMKAYAAAGYRPMQRVLLTSAFIVRAGADAAARTSFAARPVWQADTLALIPYPSDRLVRAGAETRPATLEQAVEGEQRVFRMLAARWRSAFPRSADAADAYAVALDLMGDPAAVPATEVARSLALEPDQRWRLAAGEVWTRLKFALPSRLADLRRARVLADSLVAVAREPWQAQEAAALALLAGRPGQAAQFARRAAAPLSEARHPPSGLVADAQALQLPSGLVADAQALLVFASAGVVDSLLPVEARVIAGIQNSIPAERQREVSQALLLYPAVLAFPARPLRSAALRDGEGGYIAQAELALARGDTAAMRSILRDARGQRGAARPADLMVDGLFVEASLLCAVGDTAGALARLQPTLAAIAWSPPRVFDDVARVGPLVRAAALLAVLSSATGDEASARAWAASVTTVWAGAEPTLSSTLRAVERLAGAHRPVSSPRAAIAVPH